MRETSKVISVIVGGTPKQFDLTDGMTLANLRELMEADGYQANINGEAEDDETVELEAFDYVSFAAKVKGA